MRAVLDANVVVSGLIRPEGPPGRILVRLLRDRAFELVASPAILDELRRTLRYPKIRKYLRLPEGEIDLWVDALGAISVVVSGEVSRPLVAADPDDDMYLAAAAEGLASYIVSGDRHLLEIGEYDGIPILTPRAFLTLLEP